MAKQSASRQQRLSQEELERFYRLLREREKEEEREDDRNDMRDILNVLAAKMTRKVDFYKIWATLFYAPIAMQTHEDREKALSEFLGRPPETSDIKEWAKDRDKIAKQVKILEENIINLYRKVYSESEFYKQGYTYSELKKKGYSDLHPDSRLFRLLATFDNSWEPRTEFYEDEALNPPEDAVLTTLRDFQRAIRESPLFTMTPRPRSQSRPKKPWLTKAKEELKAANVPPEDAKDLLELVGVFTPYKEYKT